MTQLAPSPLNRKIEQWLEFHPEGIPGTTFLRQIRKDVDQLGGWGADGDIPPILALCCGVARIAARADLLSRSSAHREVPIGLRAIFSDWWKFERARPPHRVERMAVLCCVRTLMSIGHTKQGDSLWQIAMQIAQTMPPAQKGDAMVDLFEVIGSHPSGESKGVGSYPNSKSRLSGAVTLLAMGHHRPDLFCEAPEDAWRTFSACLDHVGATPRTWGLQQLPLDIGRPGPRFYDALPADNNSVKLMLGMIRGLAHPGRPDPMGCRDIAQAMLMDLSEWVRAAHPTGDIDQAAIAKSWGKIGNTPLFAPLEPIAKSILLACGVSPSIAPPRPAPRL